MGLDPNSTVGDLARAGALGRAVKRVWMGWDKMEIVMDLEERFPGLDLWKYEAVVLLAQQGVASARLLRALAHSQPMPPDDIPFIPS